MCACDEEISFRCSPRRPRYPREWPWPRKRPSAPPAACPPRKLKTSGVIATQPGGSRLVVVKITTDQDGLYGYGCATFTQRADLVVPAVEKLPRAPSSSANRPTGSRTPGSPATTAPIGERPGPQQRHQRRGPGPLGYQRARAGMPVYQLLGGKCREACEPLTPAAGGEIPQVIEAAQRPCPGLLYVRLQIGVPGMAAYGSGGGAPPPKSRRSMSGPSSSPVPTSAAR